MKKLFVLLVLIAAACVSTQIATGVVEVKNAWARPARQGDNGAVYWVIENGTPTNDVLLSVSSDVAEAVELHRSQMDGDHASMQHQTSVRVAAGDAVAFLPGGWHVMLIGLTRDLKAGDTFVLALVFENSGEKNVTVTVKDDANND